MGDRFVDGQQPCVDLAGLGGIIEKGLESFRVPPEVLEEPVEFVSVADLLWIKPDQSGALGFERFDIDRHRTFPKLRVYKGRRPVRLRVELPDVNGVPARGCGKCSRRFGRRP